MLVRSSSIPVLNSWIPKPLARSCSMSFDHNRINKISKNLTESPTNHRLPFPVYDGEGIGYRKAAAAVEFEVGGGAGVGSGGGSVGSGSRDGDDANHHASMDVHYEDMIKADPMNSMLLTNYATFLKEVRGDIMKGEMYCGRAILVNPSCGNALSLYADLIWLHYRDAKRAHIYFDRAVRAAPDNCYVMASYARFLWDAEDEIEE
ncbi:hypothetical protein SASPL_126529 [Salvia splendens]|uniref:Uncharacterized protein n=1 Tax=Salvia splendens TaxID=180675 RepID=A0A8X8XJN4_SALSN|nr:uncharacterized protein LOC121748698 [Salvia splendens]KAG6413814.1 hypothetical protein SASPL_126529 [Salvia splendens]